MEIVIDIQPFFDKEHRFTPKEVGILSLDGDYYAHWIVKAPHDFSELNGYLQRANNTLTRFVHGVEWFEGDVSIKRLHENLKEIVKKASKIYTHGDSKEQYLTDLLGRKVIDVEAFNAPSFSNLDAHYKENVLTGCLNHKLHSNIWNHCALHKAALLKKWLQELKIVYKQPPKKINNSSPLSVVALQEQEDSTLVILKLYASDRKKTTNTNRPCSCCTPDKDTCSVSSKSTNESFIPHTDVEGCNNCDDNDENKTNNEKENQQPLEQLENLVIINTIKKNNEHLRNPTSDSASTSSHRRRVPSGPNTKGFDETDGPSGEH